jgi:hypothetical protein
MAFELDRAALDHFGRVLRPLSALGQADSLNALLEKLGWHADALSVDPQELAAGIAELESGLEALQMLIEKEKITIADLVNALLSLAIGVEQVINAVSSLTSAPGVTDDALGKLAEDVTSLLVVQYLSSSWPKICVVLELLGMLTTLPAATVLATDGRELRKAIDRRVFDANALGNALRDPLGYLRSRFFLNPQGGKRAAIAIADLVGPLLADSLIDAGLAASYGSAPNDGRPALTGPQLAVLSHLLVTDISFATDAGGAAPHLRMATGLTDLTAHPGEVGVLVGVNGDLTFTTATPIGSVTLTLQAAGPPIVISARGVDLAAGGTATLHVSLEYATASTTMPAIRFGDPAGLRFEIGTLQIKVGIDAAAAPDLTASIDLKDVLLAIQGGDGDGFLASVLPRDPITLKADLGLDMGLRSGFRFRGSGSIEKRFVLMLELGPLKIREFQLGIGLSADGITFRLTGTIGLSLGPLQAVVEEMGLAASLRAAVAKTASAVAVGNLGSFDFGVGFKPPAGAGLSISAGPVTGGGYIFFDPENEEYAGVLQLSFKTIGLTVIGLLTTRLPDASGQPGATHQGFSLLLIIAFDLPPIQLGYGFTLNGVGGLLGINRTMVVDTLRNGVRNGTVDSILFPTNPVARAAEIITNLRSIFPPAEGRYVFGPMVKIGWGPNAILEFQAAVVLELLAPIRLVILGKIQAALPQKKDAIVILRLDIVGVIDFDRSEVSVDASLVDSRIATFAITGDMALRVGWGATKQFALAAGGFHPCFQPPAGFPELGRLAISLANSDNPRLRLESYFALTANSIQFGAALDIYAKMDTFAGTFSVAALANFDALIQFQPFSIQADLGASVDISRNNVPILHAALHASLTGPGPWHATGYAEFDFVGKHRIAFEASVGEPAPQPPVTISPNDLATQLAAALARADAWSALPPDDGDRIVSLRNQASDNSILVHPLGALSARQRLLPFGKSISRFGAAVVSPVTFSLTGFAINGPSQGSAEILNDEFAPGQFTPLTDDERVARPAFEEMQSGGRVKVAAFLVPTDAPGGTTVSSQYEEATVDYDPIADARVATTSAGISSVITSDALMHLARGGAAGFASTRAGGAADFTARKLAVGVNGECYVAASGDSLAPIAGTPTGGASYAEALDDIAAAPATRKSSQVALSHEVGA